ncbi:hypothetical protein D3C73_845050 [compost metagenome]
MLTVGQGAGRTVGELLEIDLFQPEFGEIHGLALALAERRGLEQAGQEVGVQVTVLGDQEVLDRGHVLEQPHVLEGTHHALEGDLVAGQAFDRLAVQQDAAAARLVEAGQAVEHGGLAGAVRADQGNHLFLFHAQGHAVDRQQAAEAHAQVFYFKDLAAHLRSSM